MEVPSEHCRSALAATFVSTLEVFQKTRKQARDVSQRDRQEGSLERLPDESHDAPGLRDHLVPHAAQTLAKGRRRYVGG